MPRKRKSKHRKSTLSHPCGCYYCVGTTYPEWIKKKFNHIKNIIKNARTIEM